MTAVVSRERARTTCLTAATGFVMLAAAFVMMLAAAPAHRPVHPRGAARPSAARLASDLCHQLTSRSDSTTVRACLAGPAAESAWAEAYPPSMITDSWSARSSGRATRPPLASAAVS
jgi:hypothetical protein